MSTMVKSLLLTLPLLLGSLPSASAFWRLECRGVLGTGRIDPLVNPGVPADHSHTIFGGQDFSFSTTPYDLNSSDCTSCIVTQDKSSYWTPSLYFQSDDGTFTEVENNGGMLAYYLLYGDNITAFPQGFSMISGDNNRRSFDLPVPDPPKSEWTGSAVTQSALAQKAIGWNCLNYGKTAEASLYRHTMPTKEYMDANCTDGMRIELMFPSCWNGKDVSSSDHKSHVAFPDLVMTGTCPDGYETRLPSLFYETIWDTYAFKGKSGQFVLSNGDTTGCGYHGDFMMGWESTEFLQEAVDTCTYESGEVEDCGVFDLQSDSVAQECTLTTPSAIADEDVTGPMSTLPGNVKVYTAVDATTSASSGGSVSVSYATSASSSDLGYSAAPTSSSESYGGIFAQVVSTSASSTLTTSTSAAAITSAPASTDDAADQILYTSIYTSNGEEVHMVMVQEDVTVTVSATTTLSPKPKLRMDKRHIHRHARKDRL